MIVFNVAAASLLLKASSLARLRPDINTKLGQRATTVVELIMVLLFLSCHESGEDRD